ncbi:SDR family NAD(P)-dependent oxidoreductase [Corynebacterium halotolerans]|uniref:Short-chain dehydrogenase/reductase SDR n=1 Tax=Corynebacterium halotolerans YIM 70093 = DSM 44683 TaxID=1121362 RepID=M1MTU0_9CORY|nr:SDR family NAD(P)-dependent oxidoreductase [Corynebacterium halotolerans]AGF71109.1 short-chain dehydrogenase/reductase SDR [Corynebacterium halotolerans YIM 70093 = DSM 44683]
MTEREPHPRVLVTTGGASGIGLEVCRRWAADEGVAILLDIDSDNLDAAVDLIGKNARGVVVNVRDSSSVDEAFSVITDEFGQIDALVNSAGNSCPSPTAEMSDGDWESVIDIHLNGTMRVCRAAYPLLKAAGGAIVNVSSVAGVLGMPQRASYNSAKHAIGGLTKSLAVEWAAEGIRVNSVGPGYVLTTLTRKLIADGALDTEPVTRRTPLGRWARPGEIADGIGFLLSNQASFITGHTLMIDGGMTIDGNWYSD